MQSFQQQGLRDRQQQSVPYKASTAGTYLNTRKAHRHVCTICFWPVTEQRLKAELSTLWNTRGKAS